MTGLLKSLGWGPKPKACKMVDASSSMTSCSKSTVDFQLWDALDQAMQWIEEQTRNHDGLTSEVERMLKLIEDMSRAQQRPLHDP
ncbi:uncharacterized protein E5676_scaffold1465G00220 [Cucumis melo var. makuwa]|uniref:Uncharacterized protein n=1 Tax=Cucumis melo var. makuwa TaxID=1194695 RepID=A0A5A7V7J7_CUCMM|nr:uncharacterized protein E6C27_scaffold212G00080 [Cucumis melo var. makuwa]TYK05867.1 uncharacterized protein E5676_scaffold1465G00220 [Cucumis melo var. makuwa]